MKEKSPQEKNAAERQVSLITEALSKAADNKGVWLNEQGKQYPRFYPKGAAVSPFNALVMGLNSDKNGFSTNLYTCHCVYIYQLRGTESLLLRKLASWSLIQ